jgi:hypothetical protein
MEIDVKCPDVLKKCCKMVSPYSCILNKYDPIDKSNQCRRLQLLNRNNEAYFLYQCWGKIDAVRKESIDCYLDLSAAEDAFYAEFYTHTGIQWSERLLTASRPDYYSFVLMNFNIEENEENTISHCDPQVESVVKRIFDIALCRKTEELDGKKLPLGMLSLTQIQKAYVVLQEALDALDVDREGGLDIFTEKYYTLIPTRRSKGLEPINSRETIQEKIDLLKELEQFYYIHKNQNLCLQSKYLSLNCNLCPVDSQTRTMIENYLTDNRGQHNMKLSYYEAYSVERASEQKAYHRWETLHNKQLLWHGTKMSNVVGILTNGLCINPIIPVAITGKMFGQGLYFANVPTKSAGYLRISSGIGAMFLCEVALGNMYELKQSQSVALPSGKHSVKGLGRYTPLTDTYYNIHNDVTVPLGKIQENKDDQLHLQYDEFVIYDQSQVKLKYLVLVKL